MKPGMNKQVDMNPLMKFIYRVPVSAYARIWTVGKVKNIGPYRIKTNIIIVDVICF